MDKVLSVELIEKVAQMLWWNAGINDRKEVAKKYVFMDGSPVPKPSWEAVQNKDMWKRMAAAAAVGFGVFQDQGLKEKFKIREDVPLKAGKD